MQKGGECMKKRYRYVVWASDCSPTGVLGVHGSFTKACAHLRSVATDRERPIRGDLPPVSRTYEHHFTTDGHGKVVERVIERGEHVVRLLVERH